MSGFMFSWRWPKYMDSYRELSLQFMTSCLYMICIFSEEKNHEPSIQAFVHFELTKV
jgi:hypothetical protein